MTIQFNNHRDLLSANELNNKNYEQRFEFYCSQFPEMGRLKSMRDCELVQLHDSLKRGYDLQTSIDSLAAQWLTEEDRVWDEMSQELKSFLWEASSEVLYNHEGKK